MELRVSGGYIQYSTDGEKTWSDLIAVEDLKGDAGAKGEPGIVTMTRTEYEAALAAGTLDASVWYGVYEG